MRRFLPRAALGAALAAALLAGCASPEPAYYTLAPVPGVPAPAGLRAPRTVELRRIGLAGYLDRPDIVNSNSGYRLRLAANARWGEPLGDMIGRVLAEELTQRLTGSTVFSAAGSISADTDATVEADVQRFDAAPDGQVTLLAQVAISRGRSSSAAVPAAARPVRFTAQAASPATADQVAAMSAVLGQLADAIAALLRGVGA